MIVSIRPLSGGWTNLNWLVRLDSGERHVLRQYRWPHDSPDLDRAAKEAHLHRRLDQACVPVARIHARLEEPSPGALLMEFLPGVLLGDSSLAPEAWTPCGVALRRAHQVCYPPGSHGVIVGEELVPEKGVESWGHWATYNLLHHARQLRDRHAVPVSPEDLEEMLRCALPSLNAHTPTLLHNDPHPWNVLVDHTSSGWTCTGWLDWEYAWVGDPTWDLVHMDIWRQSEIGPTPESFWEGYGSHPVEPNRSVYEMSLYMWKAGEQLTDPHPSPSPTHRAALEYVANVGQKVEALRDLL